MRIEIRVLVSLRMDVPRVPKLIMGWARTSNHLSRVPKEYINHDKNDKGLDSPRHGFTYFSYECTYFL